MQGKICTYGRGEICHKTIECEECDTYKNFHNYISFFDAEEGYDEEGDFDTSE